jgi:hypothetical protein
MNPRAGMIDLLAFADGRICLHDFS